jgi:hypothetical protein
MARITIYCLGCNGRGTVAMRRDPYAALYVCPDCDGDRLARCEIGNCQRHADDTVVVGNTSVPMCAEHLEAWKAEEQEDAGQ